MSVDHRGVELDDDAMTILTIVARRSRDDNRDDGERQTIETQDEAIRDEGPDNTLDGATTSEMEDRTGLASGSVHHRLRNVLESENLIEVIDSESQDGAVPDRNIWGITDYGEEWLDSLGAHSYSPDTASEKALETASEARRHARAARDDVAEVLNRNTTLADEIGETADRINDRLDQQAAQIKEVEEYTAAVNERVDQTPKRETVDESITQLAREMNELRTAANQPNQHLARSVRDIEKYLDDIDRRTDENNAHIVGWNNDPNDDGLRGRVGAISDDMDEAETQMRDFSLFAFGAGCVAVLALIVAFVALLLASGIL